MVLNFFVQLPTTVAIFRPLFDLYLVLGVAVGVVVMGWLLVNMIRHRERPNRPPTPRKATRPETLRGALLMILITASILATVEIGTFLSTGLLIPPKNSDPIHIDVIAHQFEFDFRYPHGNITLFNLIVPAGEEIIFNITSKDVFHSFGIPDLNIKADAIPGQLSSAYIIVPQPADYQIRCYELCGAGHSFMIGTLHVVDPARYAALNYGS